MERTYVVAMKSGDTRREAWLEQVRNTPGVQVRGASADQAVILVDERALTHVIAQLGDDFVIEEAIARF